MFALLGHLTCFDRALEAVRVLNAPYIRLFSFWMPNGAAPSTHRDEVLAGLGRSWDAAPGATSCCCMRTRITSTATLQGAILLISAKRADAISSEVDLHTWTTLRSNADSSKPRPP